MPGEGWIVGQPAEGPSAPFQGLLYVGASSEGGATSVTAIGRMCWWSGCSMGRSRCWPAVNTAVAVVSSSTKAAGQKVILDRDLADLYESPDQGSQSSRETESRPVS